MSKRQRSPSGAMFALCLILGLLAGLVAPVTDAQTVSESNGVALVIGGRQVHSFRAPLGALSAVER